MLFVPSVDLEAYRKNAQPVFCYQTCSPSCDHNNVETNAQGVASRGFEYERPKDEDMNNPRIKTTKSALDFREGVEKGTAQARDDYEKIGAAATEGAGRVKSSMSTAFKSIQDYNTKLLEFAHANTTSAFDFFQQLSVVKSPTALLELSTEHTRKQFETFTEQTKQLASLAQSATLAAAEPLKAGVAKALNHAA